MGRQIESEIPSPQEKSQDIEYPEKNLSEASKARYRRRLEINLVGLVGLGVSGIAIGVGYYLNAPIITTSGLVGVGYSLVTTAIAEPINDLLPPRG